MHKRSQVIQLLIQHSLFANVSYRLGLPLSMTFDPKTAVFQLSFTINTDIHQPTVVYINEDLNYPQGNNIDVSPASSLTWTSPSRNYYEFLPATSTKNGTSIVIKIVPKTLNWHDRLWIWIQKKLLQVRSLFIYARSNRVPSQNTKRE